MTRIGIVTCRLLPEPDPDQELLLDALNHAGMQAELLAWDDPSADPGAFDICVLRSCWNYYENPDAFLGWIDRAAASCRLLNNRSVVRWNIHKRYLRELELAGVPIIPTAWYEKGRPVDLSVDMADRGWNDVVVKPSVSAASFQTRRFNDSDAKAGQSFLSTLVADRDAMVQRYMPAVETSGERALIWIDGELTHAVRKKPRFDDGDETVSDALPVSDAERAIAECALACVRDDLIYARVDVMEDDDGTLLISEVELIEPSLYLLQQPDAMALLVGAIRRAAGPPVF